MDDLGSWENRIRHKSCPIRGNMVRCTRVKDPAGRIFTKSGSQRGETLEISGDCTICGNYWRFDHFGNMGRSLSWSGFLRVLRLVGFPSFATSFDKVQRIVLLISAGSPTSLFEVARSIAVFAEKI